MRTQPKAHSFQPGRRSSRLLLAGAMLLAGVSLASSPAAATEQSRARSALGVGASLTTGQQLTAASGGYRLVLQSDSNLVVYGPRGRASWQSGTAGLGGVRLVLQGDGNLVLRNGAGRPVWWSGTGGNDVTRLEMIRSGHLVMWSHHGSIWRDGRTFYSQAGFWYIHDGHLLMTSDGQNRIHLRTFQWCPGQDGYDPSLYDPRLPCDYPDPSQGGEMGGGIRVGASVTRATRAGYDFVVTASNWQIGTESSWLINEQLSITVDTNLDVLYVGSIPFCGPRAPQGTCGA